MMRPGIVLGIARAEARLTRRLVRYWLFVVLATLLVALQYLQFFFIHRTYSAVSAAAASANPRYFVNNFGAMFLLVFLIGLIFLGFDIRARDKKERIYEVLDTKPVTNLEFVFGRWVGVILPCWLSVLVVTLLLGLIGTLVGAPIEPWSLASFLLLMTIPAYAFTLGLVMLLTLLLRFRLLAVGAVLAVLIGTFWINIGFLPVWATSAMDFVGSVAVYFPSDILQRLTTWFGFFQRVGVLLIGLGFVGLAAAIHPRKDDSSRGLVAAGGGALAAAGIAILLVQIQMVHGIIDKKAAWREYLVARSEDPVPDLIAVSGDVRIRPGKELGYELDLRFRAPDATPLTEALFTLNPGMAVTSLTDAGGSPLSYTHENGLLEIDLGGQMSPGEESSVRLAASGIPDPDFAYLDAVKEVLEVTAMEAQMVVLGFDSMVYDSAYVALLPGVRWLPARGIAFDWASSTTLPPDFFEVDLSVEVPSGWLVAGPGKRTEQDRQGDAARFRFAPKGVVPGVALLAARFESITAEIDDVEFEVLLHPKHMRNVELMTEAGDEIRTWLGERLQEVRDIGLDYPYGALTLVEVPNNLRGYGGGWRMDTTLSQPAVILMRESSFPTARFDVRYKNRERFESRDGGVPRAKREGLELFFENDVNGGNPFLAAARSFFTYQVSATGQGEVPLAFVSETMATRLLADRVGYFSIHLFDGNFGQKFIQAAQSMGNPSAVSDNYAEVLVHMLSSRPAVWDTILETSLADMDPWEDPKRTIDVLNLKGAAMARSLMDTLGREKAGRLLAILRERSVGGLFSADDLIAAGNEIDEDLESWLDAWLVTTELPGFSVGDLRVFRIPDGEGGAARYQILATVANNEDAPGFLKVDYRGGDRDNRETGNSDPISIPAMTAMEIGLVSSKPPSSVRIVPYLALNRDPFSIPLPGIDQEKVVEAEPFTGAREVEWNTPVEEWILVDDLDSGFSIQDRGSKGLRVQGKGADVETDGGLPVYELGRAPSKWSRRADANAYGKYRHTLAMIRSGKGNRIAVFTAEIPRAGLWELEYYLPPSSRRRRGTDRGTWTLQLIDSSGDQAISFNAQEGEDGWNSLGQFELASGEVRIEVPNQAEGGRIVMADAVRMRPVERVAQGGIR